MYHSRTNARRERPDPLNIPFFEFGLKGMYPGAEGDVELEFTELYEDG